MTKEQCLNAYGKRMAEHYDFCQLVARMREAQIKVDSHAENYDYWLEVEGNLQARVDEYLRNNYERK